MDELPILFLDLLLIPVYHTHVHCLRAVRRYFRIVHVHHTTSAHQAHLLLSSCLHSRLCITSRLLPHLKHGIICKHGVVVLIAVCIDNRRSTTRVVCYRFRNHRRRWWRRTNIRNLGTFNKHIVFHIEGCRSLAILILPAASRRVAQFDGLAVDNTMMKQKNEMD